jgi:hypothetical protein
MSFAPTCCGQTLLDSLGDNHSQRQAAAPGIRTQLREHIGRNLERCRHQRFAKRHRTASARAPCRYRYACRSEMPRSRANIVAALPRCFPATTGHAPRSSSGLSAFSFTVPFDINVFISDIIIVNDSLPPPHAYYLLRRRSSAVSPLPQPQITRSKVKFA